MQKKKLLLLICVLFSILCVDAKTSVKKIDEIYYILDNEKMTAAITHPKKVYPVFKRIKRLEGFRLQNDIFAE